MSSIDWWRNLKHPYYGNYGGLSNHGKNYSLISLDSMDEAFRIHDISLSDDSSLDNRELADINLFKALLKVRCKDLYRPIYGRCYKYGCLVIFGTVIIITKLRKRK